MSLRDLADRVGVSYSYMSMVARGHSNMGVKVLRDGDRDEYTSPGL